MERKVEISMLCQIYGKMLTKKQYEVINDYYNNDLSLSEIAENNNITRQAVRDIIKKGENKLFELEEKLAFMEKTLKQEKQYNFQAVLDYNDDSNQLWAGDDNTRKGTIDITADGTITTIDANDGLIASGALTKENISDSQYDEIYTILTEALYARLQIPRIRCPWFATVNGEEKLFLYEMNVEHTDLMYAGEQYIEDDKIKTAEGRYHVMVFSGQQISGYPTPTNVPYSEISNTCSLVSSFPVQGSLVIRVDAETESDVLACEGTLRKISAALKNRDTGEELDTGYSFDWFFGSLEEYNAITFDGNIDLQGAINYVRNQLNKDSFTYDDVEDWDALESGESAIRKKLMELMNPENPSEEMLAYVQNYLGENYGQSEVETITVPYTFQIPSWNALDYVSITYMYVTTTYTFTSSENETCVVNVNGITGYAFGTAFIPNHNYSHSHGHGHGHGDNINAGGGILTPEM